MPNFLPILLEKARTRTLSPREFSVRWHSIRRGINERCACVRREFEDMRQRASGRVSKGRVDRILRGVSEKEIEYWQLVIFCIENWLERSGSTAYLLQAQESFAIVEKLCSKRVKALKAVWEGEFIR
ncbi:MAG: hypothetical protein ACI38Q_03265 [Candidatus Bruticola sp.]